MTTSLVGCHAEMTIADVRGRLSREPLACSCQADATVPAPAATFAFTCSNRAASAAATSSEEGMWLEATKPVPDFSLADLSGKTWTLKGLNGKVLLINLWATWCGPCMRELPHVQKLYDRTKERSDVQVLTFNVDSDLGLVAPFMKEKNYNFPVLPAYDLVLNVLDTGMAIPQNWLVDRTGRWRLTGIGFMASGADWEGEMLKKLEGFK